MKRFLASLAVAIALSLAGSIVTVDTADAGAKKPAMKSCAIGKGKKAQKWQCQPDQTCCVTPEGKGVCGIAGLGCL